MSVILLLKMPGNLASFDFVSLVVLHAKKSKKHRIIISLISYETRALTHLSPFPSYYTFSGFTCLTLPPNPFSIFKTIYQNTV